MSTALKHNLESDELSQKPPLGENFAWWVFDRKNSAANDCCIREKPEVKLRLVSGKLFPGQYYDQETGLHYNYFRDYNPATGRYITSDPIGLDGGLNTYGYAIQNPLIYFDPLGLACRQTRRGWRCTPRTGSGGRVGVFGCMLGCLSYTEGDRETQASISPTLGGGLMLCPPKPDNECEDEEPDPPKKDCGMYDPNCDNNKQPSVSITRGGAGIGVMRNADGDYCILIGVFASYPIVSPTFNLGGISE